VICMLPSFTPKKVFEFSRFASLLVTHIWLRSGTCCGPSSLIWLAMAALGMQNPVCRRSCNRNVLPAVAYRSLQLRRVCRLAQPFQRRWLNGRRRRRRVKRSSECRTWDACPEVSSTVYLDLWAFAREGPHYSWPAPFLSNRIKHKFCMPSRCLCTLAKHSNCFADISRLGDIQFIVEAHD